MSTIGPEEPELRARIRQQEAVAELGQQALENDDLDQLMHDAAAAVAETLDNDYCKVLELMPGGDEVLLRQGVGWQEGLVGNALVPTDLDSQAGYTLLSEEPVIVDDLRTEDRFSGPELLTSHDVISGISVIIGSVDDPWGVLGTHTTELREFSEHDAHFVQSVANVIAAAIDRKATERQLRERESQLNVATEAASIGLWKWDIQEDIVTADEFVAESYGMDQEMVTTGAPMEAYYEPVHPEDMEQTWAQLERALETGELEAEYRVRNADGKTMWMVSRGAVEYDDEGEPLRMHGAVTDITERKRREQALRKNEERYRDLFNSMSEGYCVIEKVDTAPEEPIDFRYIEANSAFVEHSGVEGVVGRTIRDVVPGEDQEWFDIYDSVVRTGEAVRFERELVTQGRFLECYAFPVGDKNEEQVGVIFTDVTERVKRERQLERLIERLENSNERLEQFAYAASHDMQEPLRMVSSYLQLIADRYADALDADGEEFLEFAIDGADRMREMIDALLTYSQVEKGDEFTSTDCEQVLKEARDDLRIAIDESNATITADPLPTVPADENQLIQVFENLLSNAIKYSGDGAPRVHVSAERDQDEWVFSVRDNGIGIDSTEQKKIFDVFQRLHTIDEFAGTGIGLALCQRIIERHNGRIWVESEPGEGSTFYFTLPTSQSHDE